MRREDKIVAEIRERLKEKIITVEVPRERRIFAYIKLEALKESIKFLKDMGFKHLSTITGVDMEDGIELIYHLALDGSIELSLRLKVQKDDPRVPTITDIIPGAVLYEREVHDMFGVNFEGHPDLSPLILPEKWPRNIYPLRKKYALERLRNLIFKEEDIE
ncbi:NADH-quinone oxidoreductase subunit C [Candidatus Bathyarchaeota archaeon]|nr:NADH-quinone oxidoreductase subunit C [Candidatus Bathyarchaeota archaeon]